MAGAATIEKMLDMAEMCSMDISNSDFVHSLIYALSDGYRGLPDSLPSYGEGGFTGNSSNGWLVHVSDGISSDYLVMDALFDTEQAAKLAVATTYALWNIPRTVEVPQIADFTDCILAYNKVVCRCGDVLVAYDKKTRIIEKVVKARFFGLKSLCIDGLLDFDWMVENGICSNGLYKRYMDGELVYFNLMDSEKADGYMTYFKEGERLEKFLVLPECKYRVAALQMYSSLMMPSVNSRKVMYSLSKDGKHVIKLCTGMAKYHNEGNGRVIGNLYSYSVQRLPADWSLY